MTSVEQTAYRVFPRLMMTRELYLFYSPSRDELAWAREKTDTDEHLPAGIRVNGQVGVAAGGHVEVPTSS
ncbi:hypothetical protein [Nonomuraea sp. NPDC049158]|uniref:hypothetical protein n=1 Tax=Nonomuraea sp. NPDC049158 TaxID=3155649 RepID=UPI0033EDF5A2